MELSPAGQSVSLLGVDYTRFNTAEGGDIYLQLIPELWRLIEQ